MSYLRIATNTELARQYQMFHNEDALSELERRDEVLRRLGVSSCDFGVGRLLDKLGRHRRQDVLDVVSKPDKQLFFSFAEGTDDANNLSVESYEAGYSAGWKASRKELRTLQEIAEKAGETLTCRLGRPVITRAMREHMPCPFEHSEPDL